MSAPREFEVRLLVGRILTRRLTVDDADLAEAIGRYLFLNIGPHLFISSDEEIVDLEVEPDGEEMGR